MDVFLISKQIKVYGTKEMMVGVQNRLCYLIACENCGTPHYKAQCEVIKGLNRNKRFFCSQKCQHEYHSTSQNVMCANCGKDFWKLPSQITKSKSKNNFCSKSCAATFNNKHKQFGTRRSKIETLIETMLVATYPTLEFQCNQKDTIGSELDFYFPTLKLAIQIQGPLHYQPIYGQAKLDQIQCMDEEKRVACLKQDIRLIELDCSDDKYLNKKKIEERLLQIKTILAEEAVLETDTLASMTSFPN